MVEDVIKKIIVPVFSKCAEWTDSLLTAISGKGVVLGVFLIVLVIGLLFIPMRGGNLVTDWSTFRDFNASMIHKGKYSSGTMKIGSRSTVKKGKFETGNKTAQAVRRSRHR